MKIFGQENLGRPDLEVNSYIRDFNNFLDKEFPGQEPLSPQALLVFTNPKVTIQVKDAPFQALSINKFKDFIRKKGKVSPAKQEMIAKIQEFIGEPK